PGRPGGGGWGGVGGVGGAGVGRLLAAAALARAAGTRGPGWAQGGRPTPDAGPSQADQLSKAPALVKQVEAEYPPDALAKGIEADVVLLLDIDAEGKVDSVGVAEPATPPGMGFDEAAIVAAQQFEFSPAELDGQPIA